MTNEMRKLIEATKQIDENSYGEDTAYVAARLYISAERGTTKPQLAKQLSDEENIDISVASMMIDAIDAYVDIRE